MDVPENIRVMIDEKLRSMGLELYDLKHFQAGSRGVLRVYIDREDPPVSIDDCERASRDLSVMLDVEEFSTRPYSLEVSSPGVDRPLVNEKDYRRTRGHYIRVQLSEAIGEKKGYIGKVMDCADGSVTLDVEGREIMIPLAKITQAKIEVVFK